MSNITKQKKNPGPQKLSKSDIELLSKLNKFQLVANVSPERINQLKNQIGDQTFIDTFQVLDQEEYDQILNPSLDKETTAGLDSLTLSRNFKTYTHSPVHTSERVTHHSNNGVVLQRTGSTAHRENNISEVFYASPRTSTKISTANYRSVRQTAPVNPIRSFNDTEQKNLIERVSLEDGYSSNPSTNIRNIVPTSMKPTNRRSITATEQVNYRQGSFRNAQSPTVTQNLNRSNNALVYSPVKRETTERVTSPAPAEVLRRTVGSKASPSRGGILQRTVGSRGSSPRGESIPKNPLVVSSEPNTDLRPYVDRKPWPGLAYFQSQQGSKLNLQSTQKTIHSHNSLLDRANHLISKINQDIITTHDANTNLKAQPSKQSRTNRLVNERTRYGSPNQVRAQRQPIRQSRTQTMVSSMAKHIGNTGKNATNSRQSPILRRSKTNKMNNSSQKQISVSKVKYPKPSNLVLNRSIDRIPHQGAPLKSAQKQQLTQPSSIQNTRTLSNKVTITDSKKKPQLRTIQAPKKFKQSSSQPSLPRSSLRQNRANSRNSAYSPILEDINDFRAKPLYSDRKNEDQSRRSMRLRNIPQLDRSSKVLNSSVLSDQDLHYTSNVAYFDDAYYHKDTFKRNTYNRGPSQDIPPSDPQRVHYGRDQKGGRVYYALPKTFYSKHGYKCDYEGYESPDKNPDSRAFSPRYENSNLASAIENAPAHPLVKGPSLKASLANSGF